MSEISLKRKSNGIQFRTFESEDEKNTYIVSKESDGSYHTFVEVEAKDAAIHCGSTLDRNENTRSHWNDLWNK